MTKEEEYRGEYIDQLRNIFHDPKHPAGYSSPGVLWKAAEKKIPIRNVRRYLEGENVYTLHSQLRRKFKRNVAYADVADDCWQCDLSDLRSLSEDNDGHSYLLCVICVFSKYAWCVSLKNKTATCVISGFNQIFSSTPRRCHRLISDAGGEFVNKTFLSFLKRHGIEFYRTYNPDTKAQICERFQRTLKNSLFRVFTDKGSYRYVDGILHDVLESYNSRYHRSIKMTPKEGSDPKRTLEVYENLYGKETKKRQKPRFREGDYVRISREKKRFEKGYTWNWSEEIYKITRVLRHTVPCYKIHDLDGDEVIGSFYEAELQKVTKPEQFEIEYIVQSEGKGNSQKHLVHWRGYTDKSRSWVFDKDIIRS